MGKKRRSGEFYKSVIIRLKEYRNQFRLTQEEMGRLLGVSQSHYYKIEAEENIISLNSLQYLQNQNMDIVWLLTGNKLQTQSGIFDDYFGNCINKKEKIALLHTALWCVEQGKRISRKTDTDVIWNNCCKILQVLMHDGKSHLLWENIRWVENISQKEMAFKLEMTLGSYRKLEKEKIPVDAAVLSALYGSLGYSPLLILNQEDYGIQAMNTIWETFDERLQKRLLAYIQMSYEIIKEQDRGLNG